MDARLNFALTLIIMFLITLRITGMHVFLPCQIEAGKEYLPRDKCKNATKEIDRDAVLRG